MVCICNIVLCIYLHIYIKDTTIEEEEEKLEKENVTLAFADIYTFGGRCGVRKFTAHFLDKAPLFV